jgi:hypothetical protein
MAGLLSLDLICSYRMRIASSSSSGAGVSVGGRPQPGDLWRLVAQPRVALFVVWCTLAGVLTSLIWQWLSWLLSDLASAQAHSQVTAFHSNIGG